MRLYLGLLLNLLNHLFVQMCGHNSFLESIKFKPFFATANKASTFPLLVLSLFYSSTKTFFTP